MALSNGSSSITTSGNQLTPQQLTSQGLLGLGSALIQNSLPQTQQQRQQTNMNSTFQKFLPMIMGQNANQNTQSLLGGNPQTQGQSPTMQFLSALIQKGQNNNGQ